MILNTKLNTTNDIINIAGANESKLKIIGSFYDISITINGLDIVVDTKDDEILFKLDNLFSILLDLSKNINLTALDIEYITQMNDSGNYEAITEVYLDRKLIFTGFQGKPIYAKTYMQKQYINAINHNDLVFAIGSAGTGKTYLAVVMAVKMLKEGDVKKIILTRPAVEAGESLGFLPGDLKEKIDPYLRPLYDALYDCLGVAQTNALIEKQVIEIAPLAYMRGRTLDNALVILDEAQNTTAMQVKMFLTRLGFNSKMIVTGDISQIDLPKNAISGLKQATSILKGIRGIEIIEFLHHDVIRHPLVGKILMRYDNEN